MNKNYNCDININNAHTNNVTYIAQLDNNKLISCSDDKAIKIWSITQLSYQCDYTINNAHDNVIFKVIPLRNNKMVSWKYGIVIILINLLKH